MGLDNVKEKAINSHEGELESALKDIREKGKSLKSDIMEIDNNQLKQIVEKNFKDASGKWKTYQEMVKTPGYNFIVQATIDLFGGENSKLDAELKKYGGIDMIYGKTTSRLVKEIQKQLKITPDGKAGAGFFNAVLSYLNKSGDAEAAKGDAEAAKEDAEATKGDAEAAKEDAEATKGDVEAVKGDAEATKGDAEATKGDAEAAKEDAEAAKEDVEATKEDAGVKVGNGGLESMEVQRASRLQPSIDSFEKKTENMEMSPDEEYFNLGADKSNDGFDELTKELTQDSLPDFKEIYVKFGAGTDGTPVSPRSKRFNRTEFEKKRREVVDFIENNYKASNRDELKYFVLDRCDFGTNLSGYNNEWLLGMRNLECVKGIIESYIKGVEKHPELIERQLHLAFDPELNQPGTTRDEVKERFGRIKIGFLVSDPGAEGPSDPGAEGPSDPGAEGPSDPGAEGPEPGTQDSELGTQDPEPGIQDPEPGTQDPEPGTQDPEPGTQDPEPGTSELGS